MADGERDDGQERSHEPTERRREEFRERGQVPRSREVVAAISLSLTALAILAWMPQVGRALAEVIAATFGTAGEPEFGPAGAVALAHRVGRAVAWALLVPLAAAWGSAVLVEAVQSRGAVNRKEPLKFQWERLDPVQGAKQQFLSLRPLVELGKSLAKLFVIGWLVWAAVRGRAGLLPALVELPPEAILRSMHEVVVLLLLRALPVALTIAALDYLYQWYQLHEQMKMTREEVKEEQKKTEGDPHIRAARRQRMRRIAMQNAIRNVARADVLVTNPTHFAVALRYRRDEAPAPVVVARGVDHLALKMRAEARRLGIPCVEDRPLARALYHRCREGRTIPEEYYGPVARVLAVVMRARARRRVGSRR